MTLPTQQSRKQRDEEPGSSGAERVIRVLVVDDEPLMAAVTASALDSEDDIAVTGLMAGVGDTLERAGGDSDVILISTSLPDDGALRLVEALAKDGQRANIVVTGLGLSEREVLAYVEAGADAYVLKESGVDDLLHTVRAAADGTALASPEVIRALMERVSELVRLCGESGIEVDGLPTLTDREEQVLRLIARGKTNPEIANELGVSVGTVKQHVHNTLRKLNVSNRQEAARYFRLMTTFGVPEDF
jgi:DNA-binding NarL/FixJ family response regulator